MKKPSKVGQKSAPRAPSARARRPRATRLAPASAPVSVALAHPAADASASDFSRGDRLSLVLLLLPVMVLALAVGAVQSLAPNDSARRQLALLPATTTVPAAPPRVAVSAEPGSIEGTLCPLADRPAPVAAVAATPVQMAAVYERASLVPTSPELHELLPGDAVVAEIATLGHPDKCVATPAAGKVLPVSAAVAPSPEAFGRMLAAVARRETEDLVVYTDKYRDMGFPMGDVRPLFGVCTDVVVRAYRALGIDLQVLVHNAKLGTGDPSIDHRRVETLRRFFAKYGTSIPVTDFAEEYLPGDIVTYRRPEGRGSQTHIAIVSDVMAPSGRPMVVHNRGWGPQIEDALFANGVTGHYRFSNTGPPEQTVSPPATPPSAHHVAQSSWLDAERLKVSVSTR